MKKNFIVGIASSLVGAFLWLGVARAADSYIQDAWHTWNQVQTRSSSASSTTTVAGLGYAFAIKAVGSDVSYTVSFATKTYRNGSPAASVVTTAVMTVPAGTTFASDFEAPVSSPTITVHGFTTSATHYVWLNHGEALK